MKTRLVTTALVAAAFFAVGTGIDMHHSTNSIARKTGAIAETLQTPPPAAIHRSPERLQTMVVLPEITVRPSRDEVLAAFATTPLANATDDELSDESAKSEPSALPSLNFDMPYYSFGKVMPRVSRK